MNIIEIKGLRKVYRIGHEKVVALEQIDLNIPKGQICCILGTSGSGKSTLLNMLAGLEKPTKGSVLINGFNISELNERKLAKFRQKYLGFVFQSYNLLPALTALENVAMPLMFQGMSRKKRDAFAREMLLLVGLKSRLRHKPTEMSGGQQQRVGIARAFVGRPAIVFADEPTGNLDTKTTIEVMRLMVKIAREHNQTVVLVTHDNELSEFADRIVTLIDGKIVSDRINQFPLGDLPLPDPAADTPHTEGTVPTEAATPPTEETAPTEATVPPIEAAPPPTEATAPTEETPPPEDTAPPPTEAAASPEDAAREQTLVSNT